MATVHGLTAGTDRHTAAVRLIALAVGTVFTGLTAIRLAEVARSHRAGPSPAAARREMLVGR